MNETGKEKLMESMAANLPSLRAKTGLTQAKLAEMIGVSRQTLVAIETKKRKMTWSNFLTCFLVFQKNPETDSMMKLFNINTDELEAYLQSTKE